MGCRHREARKSTVHRGGKQGYLRVVEGEIMDM
jgi:hypothetical protein